MPLVFFVYKTFVCATLSKKEFCMKCQHCQKETQDNYCKCDGCGATSCVPCAEKQCLVCPNCGGQMQYLS